MKKIIISTLLLVAGIFSIDAQVFNASAPQRLGNVKGSLALVSADGKFIVTNTERGLEKVDAATGATQFIAAAPDSYNFAISPDGKTIAYNRAHIGSDKLRRVSLEIVDVASGKNATVVKATRELNSGVSLTGNTLTAVADGKIKTKALGKAAKVSAPMVSINYGHLDLTHNGKTVHLDPLGEGSYLWPSISPDGKRILFRLVGEGVYTCNLDGSDVRLVTKKLSLPVWAGNDAILGVVTTDDSQRILTSRLMAVSLKDGAQQQLTPDSMLPMGPSCNADGTLAAFYDGDGSLYTIKLQKL